MNGLQVTRQLFILAGQRHKEYLTDFLAYNIDTDTGMEGGDGTYSLSKRNVSYFKE